MMEGVDLEVLKKLPRPELFDFEGISMIHFFTENWEKVQNFQARPDDILIATYPKAGPEERLYKRGRLMKWARDKAVAAAFWKVVLIVLENGKVAVERRVDPEERLPCEELDEGIQVNVISWTDLESDGEWETDLPWDFTLDLP